MKKLLLLYSVCFCFQIIVAQEPELIEETWYLRYVNADGEQFPVPLNENFNLQFSENGGIYSASANGVENSLSATVIFNDQTISFQNISETLLACGAENCNYESLYFHTALTDSQLTERSFNYDLDIFNNGSAQLRIWNPSLGVTAYYTNQPLVIDPVLFQTWYLYLVTADLGPDFPINPSENIQVTINEDLSFTAIDGCKEISGTFEYYEDFVTGFYLQLVDYNENTDNCEGPIGSSLNFGDEFTPLTSEVSSNQGTDYFFYDTAPGFGRYYRSDLLSTPEFNKNNITISPNPASNNLFINSVKLNIKSYSIISATGKIIKERVSLKNETIDVSFLQQGLYFIKFQSLEGNATKKFIKK